MKNALSLLIMGTLLSTAARAQNQAAEPIKVETNVSSTKHVSSSILLWMRADIARQAGMDRWAGPHALIIAANKGLREYRQIHFAEVNPGLWPTTTGVETSIPVDRTIDGVADVTLKNLLSVLRGKDQNRLAYKDEVNIFKRTLLYAALPKWSRWYNMSRPEEQIEARSMVFFRKREGIAEGDFKKFIAQELAPALANTGMLKELRSKAYMPWKQKQWDTPNVSHDNPEEVQFQASLILGFADAKAMEAFFNSAELKVLASRIAVFCSAVHAYEVEKTLTFVKCDQ
ncbi:MAG: strictosidine synthase [Flavobacteriales bacterium]|nr:strictosidine synthase [Flavobacteriales bacterium]